LQLIKVITLKLIISLISKKPGRKEDIDFFNYLIERGGDINFQSNPTGVSLLHNVVFIGNIDMIEALLKRNVDVDVKNIGGETPLHYSAIQESKGVTQLLIKSGANIQSINIKGHTAIDLAESFNNKHAYEALDFAETISMEHLEYDEPLSVSF